MNLFSQLLLLWLTAAALLVMNTYNLNMKQIIHLETGASCLRTTPWKLIGGFNPHPEVC